MSGVEDPAAHDALRTVVTLIRSRHHACERADGCPWPVMFEYDVTELWSELTAAGWTLQPTRK